MYFNQHEVKVLEVIENESYKTYGGVVSEYQAFISIDGKKSEDISLLFNENMGFLNVYFDDDTFDTSVLPNPYE